MGGFNMSRESSEMPPEMIAIIEQVFGESSTLRQGLLGTLLGALTGAGGPMEWIPGGEEREVGHYERQLVPTGTSEGEGGAPEMVWRDVWVGPPPIEPGEGSWRETGEPFPMIAQAQEAQRRATSNALAESEENLAMKNLMGTPFGENILATMSQTGRQNIAGVEQDFISQLLQMIPGMVTGNIQSIMGALPGTREQSGWTFGAKYSGAGGGAAGG